MDIPRCRECNTQIQATRILCRKCGKKASQQGKCARCGLNPKELGRNMRGELTGTIYEYCKDCMLIRKEQSDRALDRHFERISEPERVQAPRYKLVKPEKHGTALPWDWFSTQARSTSQWETTGATHTFTAMAADNAKNINTANSSVAVFQGAMTRVLTPRLSREPLTNDHLKSPWSSTETDVPTSNAGAVLWARWRRKSRHGWLGKTVRASGIGKTLVT